MNVLGLIGKELGRQTFGEKAAPRLLGVEDLAVGHDGGVKLELAVVDDVDLFASTIQVAGKGQELEEKEPLAVIGRGGLDGLELLFDGFLKLARLVMFRGVHESTSEANHKDTPGCRRDTPVRYPLDFWHAA
jgi:hypothetical protein